MKQSTTKKKISMKSAPHKVMCFGTFDILHLGHLNYFQQAKKWGDYLIVIISRDYNLQKKVLFSEKERWQLVKNLKIVDEAILGDKNDLFKVIQENRPQVICLGYDHAITENGLRTELRKRGLNPIIKRMQPYNIDRYKASKIKNCGKFS